MSKAKKNKSKKGSGKKSSKPAQKSKASKPEQKVQEPITSAAETKVEKKPSDEVPSGKSKRDFSTYKFDGQELNKGRLVRAIISKYAQDKKPSLNQLKEAFPDSEIKPYGYGLFRLVADAKKINDESRRIRFFVKPEETVKLKDGKSIAVTNQITGDLLDRFLTVAKKHRFVVK